MPRWGRSQDVSLSRHPRGFLRGRNPVMPAPPHSPLLPPPARSQSPEPGARGHACGDALLSEAGSDWRARQLLLTNQAEGDLPLSEFIIVVVIGRGWAPLRRPPAAHSDSAFAEELSEVRDPRELMTGAKWEVPGPGDGCTEGVGAGHGGAWTQSGEVCFPGTFSYALRKAKWGFMIH